MLNNSLFILLVEVFLDLPKGHNLPLQLLGDGLLNSVVLVFELINIIIFFLIYKFADGIFELLCLFVTYQLLYYLKIRLFDK